MKITPNCDSNASSPGQSTYRPEPAHPQDDDRVSFFIQGYQHHASELYQRADCLTPEGRCLVWGQDQDITDTVTIIPVRTTFYSNDLPRGDHRRRRKFDRLWKKQMSRAHTWDDDLRNIVREEEKLVRCAAILQQCNAPKWVWKPVVSRIHQTNLNCFSRHHEGADGACIGFALLLMHDHPAEAKTTEIAKLAAETIPSLDEDTVERVIDYVFREYEENS